MWPGGSEAKPPTNTNHLRMYCHPLGPFPTRARFAFAAKEIPYQECWVDLNEKAEWHQELNGGFIPVLETPAGDLIPESDIVTQYAIESVPRD